MYFGGYLLLYAWYGAVVTDSRFVLTLFCRLCSVHRSWIW